MRRLSAILPVVPLLVLLGCAGPNLAGTYRADVRLAEGLRESTDPGYSLAEMKAKLQQNPRTLVLGADGRYTLQSDEFVEQGTWKLDGDVLLLHGDTSNGIPIQLALQEDRRWRLGESGEIISDAYRHYNLEEVYLRQ